MLYLISGTVQYALSAAKNTGPVYSSEITVQSFYVDSDNQTDALEKAKRVMCQGNTFSSKSTVFNITATPNLEA